MLTNTINDDLLRVKKDEMILEFIKNQTTKICLAAVKQDGPALEYVNKQTPEICLIAVMQNGWAIYYVTKQTPEICLAAVKQDGRAIEFVKNQTPKICLVAAISILRNRSEEEFCEDFWGYHHTSRKILLPFIKEAKNDFYQDLIAKVFHPDRCERMIASYGEIWTDTFF